MSRVARLVATLLVMLLLLAAPALGQSGSLIYHDDAGRLDRSQIQSAAAQLVNRGAKVAIYTTTGGGPDDFLRRLEQDGLASGGSVDPYLVAIYVSTNPNYSEIRGGDNWNAALKTNNNIDAIRNNELNAGLRSGDFTAGFVNALTAIDRAIASPPRPGGGTEVNVGSGTFVPIVLGVIFLVLLLVVGPIVWRSLGKRRAAAQAFEQARQAAEDARRQAGAAIADMGQALKSAQEKAPYDAISYAPADAAQIGQLQGAAEAQFVKAQEAFDQAGEALAAKREPAQADYQASAQAYQSVTQLVAAAREPLEQAEARRAELDKINAAAPGEVDRAKKALADVAERLQSLGQDFARPDAIARPAADMVARAESLLAEHRAADSIAAAGAASATIAELSGTLARYADLREGISAGRAAAEKAAAQGYRVDAGLAAFDRAEDMLRQAAAALEGDVASAGKLLDQAEAARAQGVARGGGMPALRRENDARLAQTAHAGEQIDAYIAEGRRAFDLVDEFAEANWTDIRGNGSEAEEAAARARALWERAKQRSTMEQQDFLGAKEDLDAADQQIAFARTLVDAIVQRLKDLEAARDATRQEIADAQADVDQGWEYLRTNDPDVGKNPERDLTQAGALLEQASAELKQARPDWLAIVRQAQEANRLADQAIANARSEVEAMNKLRAQAARAQQLATAEVQKVVQFLSIHDNDLPPGADQKVQALQSSVQSAYAAIRSAEQDEEEGRAEDLRSAIKLYT
ncbi:MAG TPA: chromosome partitioning protein ParA, partial [Roseiflexaceae bacterium]